MLSNSYRNNPNEPIPSDWEISKLEDITLDFFSGGTPSTKHSEYWNGKIEWTTSAQIGEHPSSELFLRKGAKYITELGLKNSASKLVPKNNLLVGTRVGVGKVSVNLIDVAISQDLTALIVDCAKASPEFVAYAIRADIIQNNILSKARGTTIKGIPRDDLKAISIPLPPLPEQRLIAHVLSTVRQSIEATERVIAAARELKRSLMKYLFTYGPVPIDQADQVVLKETEIGEVPEGWEVVRLGNYSYVTVSTSSLTKAEELTITSPGENILLYLKVSDLNHPLNQRIVRSSAIQFKVSEDSIRQLSFIPPGSVVFPKRGAAIATNKKRLTAYPSLLDPNLIAVTPKERITSAFCHYWFEQFDLSTITDDNTLPQLNKKDVEPINIPLPPKAEQIIVSNYLSMIDHKVDVETARKTALEALFNSLLHHLMTGKIRVTQILDQEGVSQ